MQTAPMEHLLIPPHGDWIALTLNRAQALNKAVQLVLFDALACCAANPQVRVVLIHGAEGIRAFREKRKPEFKDL